MKQLLILSALCSLLSAPALAQTKNVTKTISTNGLVENLVVPSGKTLTINSGGSIVNNGTATGFSSSLTVGTSPISGGTSGHVLTNNGGTLGGLDLTALYQPLDAGLTALAGLTDARGVLRNAGNGTLEWVDDLNINGLNVTPVDLGAGGQIVASYRDAQNQVFGVISLNAAENSVINVINLTANSVSSYMADSWERLDTNGFHTEIGFITPTADRALNFPDESGTLISTGGTGTVTNTMLAGSIAISKLAQGGATSGQAIAWNGSAWAPASIGVSDGDKGSITVSGSGSIWTIDASAVTDAMLAGSITPSKITGTAAILGANTFTGVQTLPAGTASAPSLTFGDSNTGIYRSGSGEIAISTGGSLRYSVSSTGGLLHTPTSSWMPFPTDGIFYMGGPIRARQSAGGTNTIRIDASNSTSTLQYIGWEVGGGLSASFYYDAAGRIQLGADAATPVAQTLKAHDGTGTNIDGASLTLSGGNSTGTGDDGDVILSSTMTGSSGSSANTQQTRAQVVARFKNLTEASATNLVSIALGSGRVTGGTATLTVWASDGTDHQALTSEIRFAAVNKAGTVTATCTQTDGTTAASAGTLTVTYDATTSGNNVILRANATSSLTQTILRSRIVINALNGDDTQVVTPQ